MVILIDQRNHGARMLEEKKNLSWDEGNISHAQDLFSTIEGTTQDVSLILSYLPSILFPNDEMKIVQYGVSGISLGGHVCWLSLCNGM